MIDCANIRLGVVKDKVDTYDTTALSTIKAIVVEFWSVNQSFYWLMCGHSNDFASFFFGILKKWIFLMELEIDVKGQVLKFLGILESLTKHILEVDESVYNAMGASQLDFVTGQMRIVLDKLGPHIQ
uniref:Uncharacterized protein n=1 Tax=Meloidogyne floridensis TaxID=298350 RepID=A0A915P1M2_9BILA